MTARIVLHVGMQKTGTTALQGFLSANDPLLREAGVGYAALGRQPNHHLLAAVVVDPARNQDIHRWHGIDAANQLERRDEVVELIRGQAAEVDTLIVSSEHLSSRAVRPADLAALRAVTDAVGGDLSVILYLRRPEYLIPALYSTAVRAGQVAPFDLDEYLQAKRQAHLVEVFRRWHSHFGDCLGVRMYREEWKADPAALPKDFCDAAGIRWDDRFGGVDRLSNRTLDSRRLEAMRLTNAGAPAIQVPSGNGDRPAEDEFALDAEQVLRVRQHFSDVHARLAPHLTSDDAAYLLKERRMR